MADLTPPGVDHILAMPVPDRCALVPLHSRWTRGPGQPVCVIVSAPVYIGACGGWSVKVQFPRGLCDYRRVEYVAGCMFRVSEEAAL